jgi:hypothetical protein
MSDEIKDSLELSDEVHGETGAFQEKDMQIPLFNLSKVRHDKIVQLQGVIDIQATKIPNPTCFVESVMKLRMG